LSELLVKLLLLDEVLDFDQKVLPRVLSFLALRIFIDDIPLQSRTNGLIFAFAACARRTKSRAL